LPGASGQITGAPGASARSTPDTTGSSVVSTVTASAASRACAVVSATTIAIGSPV
jgi:hypothetical protein